MPLINKAYYVLKPFLPWRLRLALRRWRANRRRTTHAGLWPIDEEAGTVPPNWPGWPEEKQFAVILTHDVEGAKGLKRVERLMNLEAEHGFRSCFNLVPEWEYHVPDELRQGLDEAGFEVGVHGLEHDGKLYASKTEFAAKATLIRKYLKQWNATGFRSPLMQHKLAWLHQLGVEYDSSTFDTDPFEPEPDGAGTIFPFWVPGLDGTGYVELPYTLVQDFTLFVVLRERDIDIWKRKVDWIAERGGMVLLNTHPDYICFEGKPERDEYPVSYYEELLRYLREKYEDSFWTGLPREVARYYCVQLPAAERNTRRRICMLAYSHYESDNRVRRYAETLAKRGDHVDVIALSGTSANELGTQTLNGVTVYHVQHREHNERGKWTYARRLLRFLVASSVLLTRRHNHISYDLVHVHNMPDFLVFAAWYPKWTGAKLILDIHDVVPELFASKFGTGLGHWYVGLLKKVEEWSTAFADHVIIANHLWYEKLVSRSVPREKCSVVLNHVDPAMFYRRPRTRTDGKCVVLFPGSVQWHQGLDLAIEAFARVKDRVANAEFHVYGNGESGMKSDLAQLANRLGLNGAVQFHDGLPLHQIADVIANADLGIVPKRANSFGNEAYSTKIMEFMSQGVPVVVSRTKIDSYYFDDSVVRFFPSGETGAMAEAMLDVIQHRTLRESLVQRGFEYVARHSWETRKKDYLELVDRLCTESFEDCAPSALRDITS
ncbi:MAG: glycosyltransferase [Bryobacterales bacterium]|nr:glycosyltransferase [Bryobacterales bacterium]